MSVTGSGGAIKTLAWVRSWACPGPILGPRGSRPDSPCALFYRVSEPSRSRGGAHPGPSWSHPDPERSFQDRAWTGRNRLLGHFRILAAQNCKSRIANRTIPRIVGVESPEIPQREYKKESNRSEVESRKVDSESPSESHPIDA